MSSMETSNYEKMLEFLKEGGEGGGDGASINGLNGTVFTSANAGIFTPTYGGDSKKKKARKRKKEHKRNTKELLNKKKTTSGVEKLDAFVRDMPTTKVSKAIYDKNLPDKTGQFQSDSAATQGAGDTNVDKIDWKKWDIDKDAPTPNSNMNSLNGSLEAATQSTKPQPEDPSVSMQDVPKAVAWQNKTTVQKSNGDTEPYNPEVRYDTSFDAVKNHIMQRDNLTEFPEYKPISEATKKAWAEMPSFSEFKDSNYLHTDGNTIVGGTTKEDIDSKLHEAYTHPTKGSRYKEFMQTAQRTTPKPEWSKEDNAFSIPPEIKEVHYNDIPEYYDTIPPALYQGAEFPKDGMVAQLADISGINSEFFTNAFIPDKNGDIDIYAASESFANYLYDGSWDINPRPWEEDVEEEDVEEAKQTFEKWTEREWVEEARKAITQLIEASKKSLEHRGLPEKFYVFRGGPIEGGQIDANRAVPTSLNPGAAFEFAQHQGKPHLYMYEVNRDDILLDMNAIKRHDAEHEEELVFNGLKLQNPREIILPNRMIKNPKFWVEALQKASPGNMANLGPQPTVYPPESHDPPEYHNPQDPVEKKVDPNRFNNVDVKMNDFTDKTKENEKGVNINAIQNQWGSGNERGEYRRGADKDDIPKDEDDNLEPSESDRVMEEYERLLASIENNIQKDEGHAVYLALMDGLDDE